MSEKSRIWIKIWLTLIGVAVIGYIFAVSIRRNMVKQPEGEYMRMQDGMILAEALDEGVEEEFGKRGESVYINWQGLLDEDGERLLAYGQFNEWLEGEVSRLEEMAQTEDVAKSMSNWEERIENIRNLQRGYKKRYRQEFQLLQKDWYSIYEELLACYGLEDSIRQANVTVLGCGGEVTDVEGVALGENRLLAEEGIYFYRSDVFERSKYQGIRVYQKGEMLLTVLETVGRGMDLQNIWIMEAWEGKEIQGFYKGYEIRFPYEKAEGQQREQIGDLTFADGILQRVKVKGEKINGKLLSMGDGSMEIEGWGKYPYEEGMAVYRLYGKLSDGSREDLRIGYDFTDFVLEDGVICAGLITRDEAMENIRVVIKNTGYEGAYHEKAEFTADTAFTVRYGNYEGMESKEYQAGDKPLVLMSDVQKDYELKVEGNISKDMQYPMIEFGTVAKTDSGSLFSKGLQKAISYLVEHYQVPWINLVGYSSGATGAIYYMIDTADKSNFPPVNKYFSLEGEYNDVTNLVAGETLTDVLKNGPLIKTTMYNYIADNYKKISPKTKMMLLEGDFDTEKQTDSVL